MRIAAVLAALLAVVFASPALGAHGPSTDAAAPPDARPSGRVARAALSASGGRVGGETVETAVVIPAIPFTDAGNTCGFVDDYEEMCPYGSNSPDCVYSFTPPADMLIDINLCMSDYDTKVFVYENEVTSGAPYACDDDNYSCDPPEFLYQSWLLNLEVYAGNTYYIVVDGYSGDCGDYVLDVYDSWECIVHCPDGAILEGEVDCYDGYIDDHNGGCGSEPPVYTYLECSNDPTTICGTGGVFVSGGVIYRDTDWYMLTLDEPTTVTVGVYAEFPPLMGLLDLTGGCATADFYDYVTPWWCEYAELTVELPAGESPIFVASASWDLSFECGSDYYITIDGYACTSPVEERSWGSIKALYR